MNYRRSLHKIGKACLSMLRKIIGMCFLAAFVSSAAANYRSPTYFCGFREYLWKDATRNRVIKAAAWFPTDARSMPVTYGPLHGNARKDAAIASGRHPLIMLSHGTGGHRYNQYYLSETLASRGYIVLAVQHPKNCAGDDGHADLLINLRDRPKDISFALDQALKTPELFNHIDSQKVGVIGHSLGGYTALALLGARPDIAGLAEFCGSFRGWFAGSFCKPKREELKAWREGKFPDFLHLKDARFQAAFVMAPGVPILFNENSMTSINAPIFVFLSGRDEILKGREQAYRRYLPSSTTFMQLPDAGHYVYLMDCPDVILKRNPQICLDIGTPRRDIHPILQKEALNFFDNILREAK